MTVKRFPASVALIALGFFLLAALACRTAQVVAEAGATPTRTATRTPLRPTFTPAPPTLPPTEPPPPTPVPVTPTRAPTVRPVPTRIPTPAKSPTPPPPPPTPNPDAGWYYRRVFKGCVDAPNTRIEGTVYENGLKKNGVIVRLSDSDQGPPFPGLNDFITGTDPADYKHQCPECQGQYRLSPAEGQRVNGNWWVFVIDASGNPLSKGYFIHTQDGPGCNTATVDFVHP
jgi:hypothetical protein